MDTYKQLWQAAHQSICTLEFINDRGIRINNLVGFKVGNALITDVKFYEISAETNVRITFFKKNGYAVNKQVEIPYLSFFQRLNKDVKPNVHPLVVFNLDFTEFANIPSLKLASDFDYTPGTPVAVIGNNSNAEGLQMSPGVITSSCVKKYGHVYLQSNTVVNLESFGAPLINAETNEVLGFVNMDGLNKNYDYEYISDLTKQNIDTLNTLNFNDPESYLDTKETFIAIQNQVKYLAKMIMKYSDHGKVNLLSSKYISEFFEEVEIQEEINFVKQDQTVSL